MMVEGKIFANGAPPTLDTEYKGCSFFFDAPAAGPIGNRIFPGDDTPRTFVECNLVNAIPPPGSTLTKCNTTLTEHGNVIGQDSITVGGETISRDITETVIYGRTDPVTLLPDLKATPIRIPE